MDTLRVGEKIYYSVEKAMLVYDVTKKTIYDWIKTDRMEKKKLGSATFVRMR